MKSINGVLLPERTVYDQLWIKNLGNMNVPALEFYNNQLTFADFKREVDYYAKGFLQMGVKQGDVVTLCMPGILEFIISFYALNAIGATANGVSITFLKSDMKTYTLDKHSDTLVIFDEFYPLVKDQVLNSGIKNIIFASMEYYKSDEFKGKVKDLPMSLSTKVNHIKESDFIELGKKDSSVLRVAPYDSKRISTLLYTSGTTGKPKCVAFNDDSINALVEMHDKPVLGESVGDRSLLIIPPYYATSLLYAVNLQLAKGKTIIPEPYYNKNTFGEDLRKHRINHTVAAGSHYAALKNADLRPGDLSALKFPGSGGEGIPLRLTNYINEMLEYYGSKEKLIIGGGSSELGSSVYAAYNDDRSNETGLPLKGVKTKIINPDTGKEVKDGERGELIISSPNAMVEYFDDLKATEEYFTYDEDGIKWGHPQDIGVKNSNGTYTMLGRMKDSFVRDKTRIYMFDTEEKITSDVDGTYEVEVVALPIEDGKKIIQVAHIVLNKGFDNSKQMLRIIKEVCSKCHVDGVKFRNEFGTNPVTGKRDYASLANETNNFYYYRDKLVQRCFPKDFDVIEKEITEDEIIIQKERNKTIL